RAESSSNWVPDVVTSTATYDGDNKTRLTNVTNVANVPVGSLVEGSGVGREIYVKSKNVAAQEITLSEALYDADGTQQYTFTRFKYILDFSGFDNLQDFTITDVEFQCQEEASGILIAPQGSIMQIRDCIFNRPGHRGITSHGGGCQGMLIDRCNFISAENGLLTQDRQSVAITGNSNDIKLRNNRASQFKHFAVLSGSYNMIIGNHFFQGDSANSGLRSAGIVLALRSCHATITGNYIDNCSIEWTNEREPDPDFTSGFGFAGLTVNNNVFLCSHVAEWFSFLIVKPHGTDHFINGLNVSGNAFRAVGVTINRVERVDTSFANLDHGKAKKITFTGNTFHNVENGCSNPLTVTHTQNTAASSWSVLTDSRLAFNGFAQEVEGLALRGDIRNTSNVRQFDTPYTLSEQGNNSNIVRVIFPEEVSGSVTLSIRADD
ncbi:MAG: right-handed parallel beta-helix repeat-containing protein, partial [Rhodobacteraceae bacterium]|nr:right-handed parallel beta-helix repeat-containing protein [Paracoccaceae bacterium]